MNITKQLCLTALLVALPTATAFAQNDPTDPLDSPGVEAAEEAVEEAAEEVEEEGAEGDEYAETEEELEESIEAGDAESKQSWRVSASMSLNVGQGTFVNLAEDSPNAEAANQTQEELGLPDTTDSAFDRASMGYSIGPSYTYGDHTISSGFSVSQYLTRGGGGVEPNEVRIGDIPLNYSWSGLNIDAIDTRFSAGGGLAIPTSARSRASALYTRTSVRAGLSKRFVDSVGISLGLGASKNWNKYKQPTADAITDDAANFIYREGELIGDTFRASVGGSVLTEYSLVPSLGISWSFWDFSLSASYAVSTAWSYSVERNPELTSEATDVNGERIADDGRAVRQGVSGSIGLSYSPSGIDWLEGWGASVSLSNGNTPKTADNRSYNFPFWTFDAASNASAISFGLSYSYGDSI